MPTYPEKIRSNAHAYLIYYLIAAVCLITIVVAILTRIYFLAVIPIAGLFAAIFTLRPYWLYYTFIAVLPFSMEFEFGPLGLDIPSEPLLIGLTALSAFWLINRFEQTKILLNHPTTVLIIFHLTWAYICIIFSSNSILSLKYALSKSWFIVGSLVGTFWLTKNKRQLLTTLIILAFSTTLTVLIINVEHGFYGFTFDSINKACNPIYRNHVTYGVFIAMIFPFLFVLRPYARKSSLERLLLNFTIILFLFGIYFTYTRGAWLALPVMLIVWWLTERRLLRLVYPLSLLMAVLFFVSLSQDYKFLKYAPDYETTIYHDDLGDHLTATLEGKDMSTMERFHRWIAAFRLFKEHPLVGIGPNTFVDNYKPYTSTEFETYISDNEERSTVHNYFIYILVEQGIVGFIIITVLVGVYFIYAERKYHLIRNPKYKQIYLACILCGSVFWLNNLFSDLLEANKVAPLWLFTIGWMIRIEKWDQKESEKLGKSMPDSEMGEKEQLPS